MFYWFMKYVVIGPIVKAIFRPWIVGRSNVPASGAAILASNHLSVSDSIFSTYLVPFEAVSVLLLAALIGAIVLARRD